MLKDKESYDIDDLLNEQIVFNIDGKYSPMVFKGTEIPYTVQNLVNAYILSNKTKLQAESLKSLKRKQAFNIRSHIELQRDRESGMSIRDLAKKYNKSTTTIQKYLKMSREDLIFLNK